MNNFEKLKSMSAEELAEWLDSLHYENTPWLQWFDSKYCSQCDTVEVPDCVKKNKCKFFLEMDEAPNRIDILKMWFMEEAEK